MGAKLSFADFSGEELIGSMVGERAFEDLVDVRPLAWLNLHHVAYQLLELTRVDFGNGGVLALRNFQGQRWQRLSIEGLLTQAHLKQQHP